MILEGIRTRGKWVRVELTKKHGAFSAVSFRSNKDTGKRVRVELTEKHGGIFSGEFSK